ncbi:MAG TPA: hypothetical protein VJY41_00570 [Prolixibacteraceae bacterium]|nr:hypothetical protein [Prolixibacteraceae bacterium]
MTTIVINEKTKKGRIILDLIREMGIGQIIEDNFNENTIQAINDAQHGKTIVCEDFNDYLTKIKD